MNGEWLFLIPLIPMVGCVLLLLTPGMRERWVTFVTTLTSSLFGLSVAALLTGWLVTKGFEPRYRHVLFQWQDYEFDISFFLDRFSAVFLGMTAFLGTLVVRFSRTYMHREPGQSRFFATLMLFLAGMSTVILSGDLDTLFLGWEVVGISSFLLIGFYRGREQPVVNALKVYSVYRLCDIGLLLGAYLEHVALRGVDFENLSSPSTVATLHSLGEGKLLPLGLLILLSAAGKSAQAPFSYWMPRAMEGPTPSSAIFYGALSIHAGVFLLIRTFPIWHASQIAPWAVGALGVVTAILATGMGRVQSNIKGQIAYASVTQVGLMFLEVALGFNDLALLHFVGNASLRCYQLLVSPSVVAYLLRLQSSPFGASIAAGRFSDWSFERVLPKGMRDSFYVIASSEAYLEKFAHTVLWNPMLACGKLVGKNPWAVYIGGVALAGLFAKVIGGGVPEVSLAVLLTSALLFALHALDDRATALATWTRSLLAGVGVAAAVSAARNWELLSVLPFLTGMIGSFLVGMVGIASLSREARRASLGRFHGYADSHPLASRLVFVSFLGMSGFPISPAFFGDDLVLSASISSHPGVAAVFMVVFVVNGLALARAFSRLFFGPSLTPVTAKSVSEIRAENLSQTQVYSLSVPTKEVR